MNNSYTKKAKDIVLSISSNLTHDTIEELIDISIDMYEMFVENLDERKGIIYHMMDILHKDIPLQAKCYLISHKLYDKFIRLVKTDLRETTTSGAFSGFTPENALRVSRLGYIYANPQDYQYKLRESSEDILIPYDISLEHFYFTYDNGKNPKGNPSDKTLSGDKELIAKESFSNTFPEGLEGQAVRVLIDYTDIVELRLLITLTKFLELEKKVYAKTVLIFKDIEEARSLGWEI